MKLNEIQDLIKFVARSGVSEVEIEQKDFKITIKTESEKKRRAQEQVQMLQQVPVALPQAMPVQMPQAAPAQPPTPAPAASAPAPAPAPASDDAKYVQIKSPMIGTFYRSPGPDKPSFVNVGDTIKSGSPVCIIEAMKLFNEIESEVSGKVVKVLVDDNTPVEYDQPLFLIDPS